MAGWSSVAAVTAGAALGALLRWQLGERLNALLPTLPLGTLAANLLGGYLVGVALPLILSLPNLAPEWRLFVVTGFLGGLTTFSTFSAEILTQLQQGRPGWALLGIAAHLGGSLVATAAGIGTVWLLRALAGSGRWLG
ncbi:MAG: fluoride efflux transporter CrcB [Xanthomonadales bacterium]|jgi:CrcB protein|nr:fluoride efflux transporter CrcB [Xanthomonadales bacterium]